MNDPRVESLIYRTVRPSGQRYSPGESFEYEAQSFKLRLANGEAVFTMKEHYKDTATARAEVEPFIRTWIIERLL